MIQSSALLSPFRFVPNNQKPSHPKTLKSVNNFTSTASLSSTISQKSNYGIRSETPSELRVCSEQSNSNTNAFVVSDSFCKTRFCSCGRRSFIGASGAALLPIFPANSSNSPSDSTAMMNRVRPPRPDWYEEFFAYAMENSMKSYEVEIAGYKAELFKNLSGKSKNILELGIGTGPNLKYYASNADVSVFGVDPNKKMERYAQAAGVAAGLPLTHFDFIQAAGEALPISDASMDAVVGTLVLCSVGDVTKTLKEVKRVLKPGGLYLFVEHVAAQDGTTLRCIQGVLDPLQQILSDGCHLTRETGKDISEAGFSEVNMNTTLVSNASIINPHVYGIASTSAVLIGRNTLLEVRIFDEPFGFQKL